MSADVSGCSKTTTDASGAGGATPGCGRRRSQPSIGGERQLPVPPDDGSVVTCHRLEAVRCRDGCVTEARIQDG
jgi:hypothetical protein